MITPPTTENELLQRTQDIAGFTIKQLADLHRVSTPETLLHDKGWFGQLLEKQLGATAASKAEPDFQHLNIELKTLPLNDKGLAKESTFVSTISLLEIGSMRWQTSLVRKKCQRVLWVPIEGNTKIPIKDRRIGNAILWSPSTEQEAILENDWQELSDMISMGELEYITARLGVYLQVRPKAANAKALTWGIGPDGERIQTLPRGFYLRTKFTNQILKANNTSSSGTGTRFS